MIPEKQQLWGIPFKSGKTDGLLEALTVVQLASKSLLDSATDPAHVLEAKGAAAVLEVLFQHVRAQTP